MAFARNSTGATSTYEKKKKKKNQTPTNKLGRSIWDTHRQAKKKQNLKCF
jgi:hypothetical protein